MSRLLVLAALVAVIALAWRWRPTDPGMLPVGDIDVPLDITIDPHVITIWRQYP